MGEPAVVLTEGAGPGRRDGPEELTFELFARTRTARLGRLAQRILADPHHAEDVVQDVLARVFDRWDRIARMENPDAYVTRMTVNACTSWWRRAARREHPVDLAAFADLRMAATPDDIAALAERDRLHRLLARLPTRQRTVLVLRYLEDLPDPVIAGLLGVREVTVRTNAFHGLAELRRLLVAADTDLPFDTERVVREGRRAGLARRRRRHTVEAAGGAALLVLLVVLIDRGLAGGSSAPDQPGPDPTLSATASATATATNGTTTGPTNPTATGTTTRVPAGPVAPTTGTTGPTTRTTTTRARSTRTTSTGTTTTTRAARPQVLIGVGAPATSATCADPSCRWLTVRVSGLAPGTGYDAVVHDDTGSPPITKAITTGPDGSYRNDELVYFGFPGAEVWVVVGPVSSGRLVWPS